MIKGGLSFSQPDEVEVRVAVPLDTILALVSGGKDGYLKIPKATVLALIENTMQNPESDPITTSRRFYSTFRKAARRTATSVSRLTVEAWKKI